VISVSTCVMTVWILKNILSLKGYNKLPV
jgi:hypothetical protein